MTKARSHIFKMWRSETKAKNITPVFLRNVICDSGGKLDVMIQHVDQGLEQQRLIQKYCSETENRQQCRSIAPQLHIVHYVILPSVTACTLATSQQNHPLPLSTTCSPNYAFQSDTLYSLLLSYKMKKKINQFSTFSKTSQRGVFQPPSHFNIAV